MIERSPHCKAVGFRVPLWNHWQIEIWFCPKGDVIPAHRHQHIHSFILQIWGRMRWTVNATTREVCGPLRRRESNARLALAAAPIPAGTAHAAEALSFCVFVNIERQSSVLGAQCSEMVSAAQDFQLVT